MSAPMIPPRPSRTTAAPTGAKDSIPQIPPRPVRKLDPSPSRDTRSPLNEMPNFPSRRRSQPTRAPQEAPQRPPPVTLPSIGQEGLEYASFDQLPPEARGVKVGNETSTEVQPPEQTRNVSANMPLHAPKASVPQSTAKSRIEPVTRTDSTQAAAIGIGRARPDDDVHKTPGDSTSSLSRVSTKNEDLRRVPSTEPHPLRQRTSFSQSLPNLHPVTSRPGSVQEGIHEQGIPEIGMQIPLYPNAGDVQAPSPAPNQAQFTPGIGFFNDGSTRAHHRKRSSRHEFGPPGSYGMHGHGYEPHDQFEKEWIHKHPEQAAAEGYNIHGPPKPATALTSEELNRLVNQNSDIGMGTHPDMIGTPGADVAWGATQEFMSQMNTPLSSPLPTSERRKRTSSGTAQSPLRKASFPFDQRHGSESAMVTGDGTVIHVDPPEHKPNKVTGGGAVDGTIDLGVHGGNTEEEGGWYNERGEGTPILASDEIMKRPGSAYMQPAVSPGEPHYEDYESEYLESRRSRPSSRPSSMHGGEYLGGNLHRFMSHDDHQGSGLHTPLEEIEEYEPLIPEDEGEPKPKPKALKRPGLEHHHFPSQDIWEDTPSSLQYQTTVETPEPPREARAPPPSDSESKATLFETPEEQQRNYDDNPNDMWSDNKTLINKPRVKELQDEHRPGMQRFPSQDIWEDTPDSMRLVTTVSGPQMDETRSPPDDRPTTTAGGEDDGDARATTGFTQVMRPSIPTRPHRKSKLAEEIRPEGLEESSKGENTDRDIPASAADKQLSPDKTKAPALPDRPKPSVPARPARGSRGAQPDGSELTKSTSLEAESPTSPPVPKPKPAIPARPAGEKIAALKSGFMNDLNNRLKLGPQGPPPKAKEEAAEDTQKEPLVDARKGRAKGPARRKPAVSPSAPIPEEKPSVAFSIFTPLTMWQVDESDELKVPSVVVTPPAEKAEPDFAALEKVLSDNEAHNTEEPTLAQPPDGIKELGSGPDASLDDKISAAEKSISIESGKEVEAGEKDVGEPSADLEPALTSADVEKKELAPVLSDEPDTSEDVTEGSRGTSMGVTEGSSTELRDTTPNEDAAPV
ncbi:hypothetical protein LTR37_011399 [Vermiconidia calcicola]|uniref:Uncharacterized protein n=1 Tax=Vermiconidia calcicola TaxID=1690605 RepID=A0ACC3N2Y2_9PEZI|nr:hypothetical protein LTR37_011399 [Vermiconidia calcicola]